MTYGAISFGFFRDTLRFRLNMMYWHIMPTSTELGFQAPGKSLPAVMETYVEGIRLLDQMTFAGAAAKTRRGRLSGIKVRSP